MPIRRISRADYSNLGLPKTEKKKHTRANILIAFGIVLALLLYSGFYLRKLSSGMAMSDATDAVTLAINDTVNRIMTEKRYDYDYFVTLEKGTDGNITAITTNTARINAMSSEILSEIVKAADSGRLDIHIPLGNLLGSSLLLGRGPDVPVEIDMLTSSFVRFENDLVSTGINQSKHTLTLIAQVDIDIIVPWKTLSTTVETEILIAETVIVGRVPDTYVNMEDTNGHL